MKAHNANSRNFNAKKGEKMDDLIHARRAQIFSNSVTPPLLKQLIERDTKDGKLDNVQFMASAAILAANLLAKASLIAALGDRFVAADLLMTVLNNRFPDMTIEMIEILSSDKGEK